MSPRELFAALEHGRIAPAYLFLGTDAYTRRRAREAILEKVLGANRRDEGLVRLDLEETSLAAVLDQAASLSLFATERVLWIANAEAALPRRLAAKEEEDGPGAALAAYLRHPAPGTVLLFDCRRYGLEGEDKAKLDRVRKFYAAIPVVVEFPPLPPGEAAAFTQQLARAAGLPLSKAQIATLVEALAADADRIQSEVNKLALYAGGRPLTDAEIAELGPDARTANVFHLVQALASGRRREALNLLDGLVREGAYLPLVLTLLATQFRLALAAAENQARTPAQIQQYFSRLGITMWRSRAEQLAETLQVFATDRLKRALVLTFEADRGLRDSRPDDRLVMEVLVWKLTEP